MIGYGGGEGPTGPAGPSGETMLWGWGALNFATTTNGVLSPVGWESSALAIASEVVTRVWVPPIRLRRISFIGLSAGVPSDCTFVVLEDGVPIPGATLSIAGGLNVGQASVNLPLVTGRLSVQFLLAGATDSTTRRPRVALWGAQA